MSDERRLEELVENSTRLGIIRRMVNDADNECRGKQWDGSIETKVLRQIIGMAPFEEE